MEQIPIGNNSPETITMPGLFDVADISARTKRNHMTYCGQRNCKIPGLDDGKIFNHWMGGIQIKYVDSTIDCGL
jgi:hypothetical protein